jgi:uncharacterized protein (TIGR03435 family)
MPELDDHQLLAEFVRCQSEAAFTELVRRYAGLVYSTAFRFCSNPHHAEEITQAVFVILARKANKLSLRVVISGWLYQTARLTAANFVKGEVRRRRREQEAFMQSNLHKSDSPAWEQIAPLLDEAMGALGETDRNAVLLRYFENRTSQEIGAALRLNEETARKRVNRALEKLRHFFVKRGVTLSSSAFSGAISANSIQSVSTLLVKNISAVAVVKGAAASTSTLALVKGVLKIMAWTKMKTAIVVGAGVLLTAGVATVAVKKIEAARANSSETWQTENINQQTLDRLPPLVQILPTKLPDGARRGLRGSGTGGVDRKMMGRGFSIAAMFAAAYGKNDARVIFTTTAPAGRFDFICTASTHQSEALQKELKKQFGLEGNVEMRETDISVLTVKNPNASGLRPSAAPPNSPASFQTTRGHIIANNIAIPILANALEQSLGIPVIDETGFTNRRFDVNLAWDQSAEMLNIDGLKQALREQLGLELVPDKRSVEMLVVNKSIN